MPATKKPSFKLLKVGADVEMFLRDKTTQQVVPCVGVVGGTKDRPLALPNLPEGFARQEDNVMLEFNVPAASSTIEFVENMSKALGSISNLLAPMNLEYLVQPAARFQEEQLQSEQAKLIGCEPDYNVWTRSVNEMSGFTGDLKTLRTSGGHVHVSFMVDNRIPTMPHDLEYMESVVMALDLTLGIPFSLLEPANERKQLYGKAGAFRMKPYGIEYRVLSNYWISSPVLTGFVHQQVMKAFDLMNRWAVNGLSNQLRQYKDYAIAAINQGSRVHSQQINESLGTVLPKVA